ncbi:hypothetical protein BHM03_00059701, partial [Ensete ventricosum]
MWRYSNRWLSRLLSRSRHDLRWDVERLFPIIHHLSHRFSDVGQSFWFTQLRDRHEGPQGLLVTGQVASRGKFYLSISIGRKGGMIDSMGERGGKKTILPSMISDFPRSSPPPIARDANTCTDPRSGGVWEGRRVGRRPGKRVSSPPGLVARTCVWRAASREATSSLSQTRGDET